LRNTFDFVFYLVFQMAIQKLLTRVIVVVQASRSAIEYEPANFVAQLLVVKHKIPDFARKLCTLPLTFQATCLITLTFIDRRACGSDCVCRCTQLMRCHMCHCRSLSGCISRIPGRPAHHSGCRHGVTGGRSSLRHGDLASRPGANQFYGSLRPIVIGLHFLEEVQHMLCAIGRPYRKQMMIGILESTAAAHSDEPGVSLLW
jgi:hypothetical protein